MKKVSIFVLITILAIFFSACGKSEPEVGGIPVPDVRGLTVPNAIQQLNEAGFTNIETTGNGDVQDNWIVSSLNHEPGENVSPDSKLVLTCNWICHLYVDVKSEANLLFAKYDIVIYIDGVELGTVPNGERYTHLSDLFDGKHTIKVAKAGDDSVHGSYNIEMNGDMAFSCIVGHSKSSIDLKEIEVKEGLTEIYLTVPDVTGMVLSDAMSILKEAGFTNVREEPYREIWDKRNWTIISQGIKAGDTIDRNTLFELNCKKTTEIIEDALKAMSIPEIEEYAKENGFSVKYENDFGGDITDRFYTFPEDERNEISIVSVFVVSDRIVVVLSDDVYLLDPDFKEEETGDLGGVYYSTNSEETVKNGNAGIYSYKNAGKSYQQYFIIDFDEGYVYYFMYGEGSISGDKLKIESGNLNDSLKITYHTEDGDWSNYLHFHYKDNPQRLILTDNDGLETEFIPTSIDAALKLKEEYKFVEY